MKKFLTNRIFNFGMGARMNFLINVIGLTELLKKQGKNIDFVFTPFSYEGFGHSFYSNQIYSMTPHLDKIKNMRDDYLEYCDRWDRMINYNGLKINDIDINHVEFIAYPYSSEIPTKLINEETYKIKEKIKYDYFSLPKKIKKSYIDVCIHIRRNDVDKSGYPERYLNDDYYVDVINTIKNILGEKCKITIHTQKNNFNPEYYQNCDIIYDGEILETDAWLSLLNSDVLVISKSSFSYSSALLNDGIIFAPNDDECHDKVDCWVYDKNELENKLKKLLYE